MLQSMNERIKGWFAWVIIALIAAAFVLWGVESYITGNKKGSEAIAKVNGHKITEKTLEDRVKQLQRNQQLAIPGQTPEQVLQQLRAYVLQQLISESILTQAALKQGIVVSPAQVQQMIVTNPAFKENGRFSQQRFQQLLMASDIPLNSYYDNVRELLTVRQVAMGLQASAIALPDEIKQLYELSQQKRSFGYFSIPVSQFMASSVPNQKAIETFYKQHKANFQTPEKVSVSYLLLSPKKIMAAIKLDPKEVQQYYQDHKADFITPKRWQVNSLIVQLSPTASDKEKQAAQTLLQGLAANLKKGTSFSSISKQQGAGVSAQTVWLADGQADPALIAQAEKLKVNQVSQPVAVANGMAVIQLKAVSPEKKRNFAEAKSIIEKTLQHQKAEQQFSQQSDKLSELTYTNPSSLTDAAKALGMSVQQSPMFTRQASASPQGKDLWSNSKVIAAAFSDDVLQQGNNSNVIELNDGSVLVLRINKHQVRADQKLAAVQNKIKTTLQKQTAAKKAGLNAYKVEQALRQGKSTAAIEKEFNTKWRVVAATGRQNKNIPADILAAAFRLAPQAKDPHPVTSAHLGDGDYAVVQLKKIIPANYAKASQKERDEFAKQLKQYGATLDYQTYSKSMHDQAKIKVYAEQESKS